MPDVYDAAAFRALAGTYAEALAERATGDCQRGHGHLCMGHWSWEGDGPEYLGVDATSLGRIVAALNAAAEQAAVARAAQAERNEAHHAQAEVARLRKEQDPLHMRSEP